MNQTEIKYGKIHLDGQMVSYATFQEEEKTVELIVPAYQGLHVKIDGVLYNPGSMEVRKYVMLWTKVAGWIGQEQLLKQVF